MLVSQVYQEQVYQEQVSASSSSFDQLETSREKGSLLAIGTWEGNEGMWRGGENRVKPLANKTRTLRSEFQVSYLDS